MLPLQVILILGILFLLVLCCMIAAQLSTGPMPITENEGAGSPEPTAPLKPQRPLHQEPQEFRL